MGYIQDGLAWMLDGIVGVTGSYAIAIILVTLLIRIVLFPLTLSQTKSMAAMRVLQPKMKELQEKHKENPQEYQKKTMELYREHKVNPLGGCLPMLVQLPFLWAFFRVLQDISAGEASVFLGFWDLSQPDPIYIFPIIAALTTFLQMKQTATDPTAKGMMFVMPGMIGIFSINFPAGLVLYWIVSNVFSIGQQAFINKQYPMTAVAAPKSAKTSSKAAESVPAPKGQGGKDQ